MTGNVSLEEAAIKSALDKGEPKEKKPICSDRTLQIFSDLGKEPQAIRSMIGRAKTVKQLTAQLKEPRGLKIAWNVFKVLMTAVSIALAVAVMVFAVPVLGTALSIFLGVVLTTATIKNIIDRVKDFREIPLKKAQLKAEQKALEADFAAAQEYFEENHEFLLKAINEEMRIRTEAKTEDTDLEDIRVARLTLLEEARNELTAAREELTAARDHFVKQA